MDRHLTRSQAVQMLEEPPTPEFYEVADEF
jgi:hypothetical protein